MLRTLTNECNNKYKMFVSQKEDSAALIRFLAFMEKEVKAGNEWNEITASDKLEEYRE